MLDTVAFAGIGIAAFIIAYFLVDLVNRKFNFNVALKEKNEAAGIMIFGIFIGHCFYRKRRYPVIYGLIVINNFTKQTEGK